MLRKLCIMNVAIPILNDQIAPCFEVAKQFEIVVIKKGKVISSIKIKCLASEGFIRVRLLRLHEINTLICNGIKSFYQNQLTAMGINVITNVTDSIEDTLNNFLDGSIKSSGNTKYEADTNDLVSHDDLVSWAKELFESNGYSVSLSPGDESFLIDLVAKIKCPVCSKQIDVAICCGAQTYRADQEIREFHYNTKTQYNARVYVYLTNPQLEKSCNEYGIDFLSPELDYKEFKERSKSLIPILNRPVEGHEKAFNIDA
ncbi:MAG: hypothetical protein DRQ13_07355 [Ignavibacteriae bacterium]|nr:MAG: hypothetical protein DRQ13_07355 [Ignavibacteriota bacterium]